jgi:hypothetical protein
VQYFMRSLTRTLTAWATEFGATNLPEQWQQQIVEHPFQSRTVLHLIVENPNYDSFTQSVDARRWASVYLDEGKKQIIHQDTLDYGVIDWAVRIPPGWDYPATPAMYAYVDILTNNTLTEALIRAARLAADPPMRASRRLQADYDTGYGGVTWIERPEDIIEQVHKMGSWPVADQERERVRHNIDRWFSVQYFELLTRMEGNPPTAYHIRELSGEKATLLGPEVGTYIRHNLDKSVDVLVTEEPNLSGDVVQEPQVLLDWMRERVEASLTRMGLPVTEDNYAAFVRSRPLASLEAVYNGALSAIETEMVQNRRYMDGLALLGAAAQIWPEAPLIAKADVVMRNALEAYDWAAEDLRSPDEYKQEIERLAQSQQMQEQAAIGKDLASAAQQAAAAEKIERQ